MTPTTLAISLFFILFKYFIYVFEKLNSSDEKRVFVFLDEERVEADRAEEGPPARTLGGRPEGLSGQEGAAK